MGYVHIPPPGTQGPLPFGLTHPPRLTSSCAISRTALWRDQSQFLHLIQHVPLIPHYRLVFTVLLLYLTFPFLLPFQTISILQVSTGALHLLGVLWVLVLSSHRSVWITHLTALHCYGSDINALCPSLALWLPDSRVQESTSLVFSWAPKSNYRGTSPKFSFEGSQKRKELKRNIVTEESFFFFLSTENKF